MTACHASMARSDDIRRLTLGAIMKPLTLEHVGPCKPVVLQFVLNEGKTNEVSQWHLYLACQFLFVYNMLKSIRSSLPSGGPV